MTTWSYLGRPAAVSIVANLPGISQHLKKASVELVGPNFVDVHIPHPLGGLQANGRRVTFCYINFTNKSVPFLMCINLLQL